MIRFVDLISRHRTLIPAYVNALRSITSAAAFIQGSEVQAFEQSFAKSIHNRYCIGVSNGTDALTVTLKALHIGKGDEVIVPAFTFISTAYAVLHAGAVPVLVDVEPDTLTINAEEVRRAITGNTKAILPVHLYGTLSDMNTLIPMANKRNIAVIEDAAQAIGSTYYGKPAGSLGTAGCFSFYPSKNLGALGDAGAVVTDSLPLARSIRRIANLGMKEKYYHTDIGYNYRLDTIQAAFLSAQLPRIPAWNATRTKHAALYATLLAGLPLKLPAIPTGTTTNVHLYVIRTLQRNKLRAHLAARGIETGIHYPRPLHLQPALTGLGYRHGDFPVSEKAAREVLSLPMYPELTQAAIRTVVSAVRSFFLPK